MEGSKAKVVENAEGDRAMQSYFAFTDAVDVLVDHRHDNPIPLPRDKAMSPFKVIKDPCDDAFHLRKDKLALQRLKATAKKERIEPSSTIQHDVNLLAETPQFNDEADSTALPSREGHSSKAYSKSAADDLASRLHADRPRYLRYLRGRLPSLEDAEDALQDATLKFVRNEKALDLVKRPEAWVAVSLRRVVVDRYRRAAAQRRMTDALAAEPIEVANGDEDDELQAPAECLKSSLRTLQPEYASILRKIYLEEAQLKVVAADLNLTANNTGVRLHRARGALRVVMLLKCQTCPLTDCWARQRIAQPVTA
jgi:RNA polymerase sigma-70 factor (ECF subfamily)